MVNILLLLSSPVTVSMDLKKQSRTTRDYNVIKLVLLTVLCVKQTSFHGSS